MRFEIRDSTDHVKQCQMVGSNTPFDPVIVLIDESCAKLVDHFDFGSRILDKDVVILPCNHIFRSCYGLVVIDNDEA